MSSHRTIGASSRLTALALVGLLSGCQTTAPANDVVPVVDTGDVARFDGHWELSIDATSGRQCVDGLGDVSVSNGAARGVAFTAVGTRYEVTATVDSSGRVKGSSSKRIFSKFEGIVNDSLGRGSWKTPQGCSGTWAARRMQDSA